MVWHLHLEPECLEELTYLQKGHAALLAGCENETETCHLRKKKHSNISFTVKMDTSLQ